jgi:phospho-N-acetylmuramoyl-pentapeptide-transferase
VDAKFYSDRPLWLSGNHLLLALGVGLSGAALLLDYTAGRSILGGSLTLSLLLSALSSAALGFWVVPLLRQLKMGQVIREDGPQAHLQKSGTPTMGGVFFVPVAIAIALVCSGFTTNVLAVSALTLAYAAIGWLDDWQILRRKSNKGISPRTKLALQVGFGGLFCLWLLLTQPPSLMAIALPFGLTLPLGISFLPIAWFALVAESNATNLTDGLDGLAAGTGAIAFLGLAAIVAPTHPELMIFSGCMGGGCLGFLIHNRNPARVFMGDTGSLALGGALVAVALLSNALFGLLILSGIFLVETLSVIAQVGYYKATKDSNGIGKRLFKMAPLHHHLELTGWSEIMVVAWFYLIATILASLCLVLYWA